MTSASLVLLDFCGPYPCPCISKSYGRTKAFPVGEKDPERCATELLGIATQRKHRTKLHVLHLSLTKSRYKMNSCKLNLVEFLAIKQISFVTSELQDEQWGFCPKN